MSNDRRLPKGAMQLVLWYKGLAHPQAFVVPDSEAHKASEAYNNQQDLSFTSFNDGSGYQSATNVKFDELRALTVEYPTIALVSV